MLPDQLFPWLPVELQGAYIGQNILTNRIYFFLSGSFYLVSLPAETQGAHLFLASAGIMNAPFRDHDTF